MGDPVITIAIALAGLAACFTWFSVRTASIVPSSPERLVAELRLSQFAALLLAWKAGAYLSFAASNPAVPSVGLDIALSVGAFAIAAATLVQDPRHALTALAIAFAGHALLDVAHRPGWLADGVAPRWYLIGCAMHDLYIGALCFFPILRR